MPRKEPGFDDHAAGSDSLAVTEESFEDDSLQYESSDLQGVDVGDDAGEDSGGGDSEYADQEEVYDEEAGSGEEVDEEASFHSSEAGSDYTDDDHEGKEGYRPGGYHPVEVCWRGRLSGFCCGCRRTGGGPWWR